ncbi:MAG TPA: TonB-dependent receptor [Rhodanobacteraceae bacterium]|nr:TonB-dependent receptor [Rhodanobacteraceae bacterium]
MRRSQRHFVVPVVLVLASMSSAGAQPVDENATDVFTLGEIAVTGSRVSNSLDDDTITSEEMWRFDTRSLDDAVKLVPGVSSTLDTNGRRNERNIFVRGFDRLEVPLTIDGVRVYLPADNRLDFQRFLTADLAEVEIRKGYVSVLDGPGGMGGAINLVTRKPTKPLEAQFQAGTTFDRSGSLGDWYGYGRVGTKQDLFYAQASANYLDRDHWELSDDFRPPTPIEDGGDRNRSFNTDSRVNLKLGFTPRGTDEYTLNYTRQKGEKGAPLNTRVDPPNPPNSYWDWPWWNIENLYFLSNTSFGDNAYLKTRFYRNTFDNALDAFDDATYTTQSNNGRFRSIYADVGRGGNIETGWLTPANELRFALYYRDDQHREHNINRPTNPTMRSVEPVQHTEEETWSLAAEDTWHLTGAVDLVGGVSYDRNEIDQAQEYNATQGLFDYPTGSSHAFNGQAAVDWRYAEDATLRADVSSRTRFPTNFERFSTRFGTAVPNPDLEAERATNYEIAWQKDVSAGAHVSAAVFYSDVSDMIQTVIVDAGPPQLTQTRNVGDGSYYGVEFGGDVRLGETWSIGGNYTWLHREIEDALQPNLRPVGTPKHQALLYATYAPTERFSLTPSIEYASDRWSDVTGGGYVETGEYCLFDIQAEYRFNRNVRLAVGGRNLADKDYELAWGFPQEGRTFFAKIDIVY